MSSKALAGRSKAKTNTCRQFESTGECRFGSECKFVHRLKVAPIEVSPSVPKKKRPAKGKKKITKIDSDPRSHLQAFFDKYPDFDYNPSLPVMQEFYRMRDMLWPGRDRDDSERNEAYGGLRDALVQQFNNIYGTDERSLAAWQRLCVVLQLENIPEDLDACRELVRSTYVNLVDLVDTSATGAPVCLFWSERALSTYTTSTGKYFPRNHAYAGGLLKFLLRQIINPGDGLAHPSQRVTRRA